MIKLDFHNTLRPLLKHSLRKVSPVTHPYDRRTSIKDLVESYGVPHTEIGSLLVNDGTVNFSYLPVPGDAIMILPHVPPVDPCQATLLRPNPLPQIRFLVDVNVARLCPLLRMTGMDTHYSPNLTDRQIGEYASANQCIVLSRDRGLLRRKIIEHGHLVKTQDPTKQLAEVLHWYGLRDMIRPLSRCMQCNGLLREVAKEDVLHHLEPLTDKYYQEFSRCTKCRRIYWPGSHLDAMEDTLSKALSISLSFEND